MKGPGGSASQSIGQISYTTISSEEGKVSQGVIQVWEISVLSGEELNTIELSMSAYPNPTTEQLTLKIENYNGAQMDYLFLDMSAKLILEGSIKEEKTMIPSQDLIPGTYILQVMKAGSQIKSFKIVKK